MKATLNQMNLKRSSLRHNFSCLLMLVKSDHPNLADSILFQLSRLRVSKKWEDFEMVKIPSVTLININDN